jgi:hypothetical protein
VPSPDTGTPNKRSGPRSETGGHPEDQALTKAHDTSPAKDAMPLLMVRQGAGDRYAARRKAPLASASLYEPAAGRTWWWLSIRCPHCGSVHLGRVREESAADGPRRAGCGRKVTVKVRRTYRGRRDAGAAA